MANSNFGERNAALILLSGLPGAGKTTFAQALLERLEAEHIESDAIRRAVAHEPTFSFAESGRVFGRVDAAARRAIASGRHALVDATNLTRQDRKRFLLLARELGAKVVAVRVVAPEATIRQRLAGPREGFSKAGTEIYERMRSRPQLFAVPAVIVDTRFPLAPALELVIHLVCAVGDE